MSVYCGAASLGGAFSSISNVTFALALTDATSLFIPLTLMLTLLTLLLTFI